MSKSQKILINCHDYLHFVDQSDILFCQSDNSYTTACLKNGETITISKSLLRFSESLCTTTFIRVSQSSLINRDYIKSINKKKKMVVMTDSSQLRFTLSLRAFMVKLNVFDTEVS